MKHSAMKKGFLGLLVGMVLVVDMSAANASEKTITVGTAGVTGVYYPAGGAVCRLLNRGRKEHGIRCAVESTGGSISNLEGLRKEDLDLGIVQSDLLYNAYNGSEIFSDVGSDKKLRILFSLHAEPFTVIARSDAKINVLDDLKGKRVYMGAPGSGMRATMEEVMKRKGWNKKTFASIVDLKSSDQVKALCSGKIDAMIYAGGHPNGAVQQVTSACDTKLVPVTGPSIDELIKAHPYFSYATIPANMYPGTSTATKTFGVKAELVASSDLDDEVVYQLVKAVFDNLDNFKTLHPVFATLDPKQMIEVDGLAPIHPGALKYFKEKGLID
ncbi:MAG: TAXI family TRAP transporter solute-binding subunit [Rickettsiales bacterium]|nr:TAXI family TRAP transporter solute-binding subunit [Rickettsiales bacterium]